MTRAAAAVAGLVVAGGALADDAGEPEDLLTALHNATAQGDCARAAKLVRALERDGDAQALAVLGGRFEKGRRCLGQGSARAASLYRRAAEDGEAVAMVRLGRLYAEGRGVPEDMAKARHWFRAGVLAVVAIDAARREPILRLALDGEVPDLLAQQLTWLRLIERGGPASAFDLAMRMRTGDGVPRNEAAAEHLMGKLAAEEYPPAHGGCPTRSSRRSTVVTSSGRLGRRSPTGSRRPNRLRVAASRRSGPRPEASGGRRHRGAETGAGAWPLQEGEGLVV